MAHGLDRCDWFFLIFFFGFKWHTDWTDATDFSDFFLIFSDFHKKKIRKNQKKSEKIRPICVPFKSSPASARGQNARVSTTDDICQSFANPWTDPSVFPTQKWLPSCIANKLDCTDICSRPTTEKWKADKIELVKPLFVLKLHSFPVNYDPMAHWLDGFFWFFWFSFFWFSLVNYSNF